MDFYMLATQVRIDMFSVQPLHSGLLEVTYLCTSMLGLRLLASQV